LKPGVENLRLVVFDFETTGLSPASGERVIEIGAVALVGGEPQAEFHSLVATERKIHWAARKVHGISSAKLSGAPDPGEVFSRFYRFIADSPLVAHNFAFDQRFLVAELNRAGLPSEFSGFCTLKLARTLYPDLSSYRLEDLGRHLLGARALHGRCLHRALDDARLTAEIWLKIESDARKSGLF
jgi:DNA polymerase-3 subunit epsilon